MTSLIVLVQQLALPEIGRSITYSLILCLLYTLLGASDGKFIFLRLRCAIFIQVPKHDMGTTGNRSICLSSQYINKMFPNIIWVLGGIVYNE